MIGLKWFAAIALPLVLVGCPDSDTNGDTDTETDSDSGSATSGGGYGAWFSAQEIGEDQGALLSVWGASADDVWAVGGQVEAVGEAGVGLLMHSDGTVWTPQTLPDGTPLLNWVHGAGGETWLVGNAGSTLRSDGSGFAAVESPTEVPLWGVFVVGPGDSWAVGGDAFDSDGTGVILHWDGATWTDMPMPALDRSSAALFKVWAAAANDVWAVGDAGVIIHYDGAAWSQVPSGTGNDLISLWGTGADDIVAVGGRSIGTVARWDGAAWTSFDVGQVPGLNGVWMDADGVATLVGNRGAAALLPPGSMELNADPTTAELMVLHAVFGFGDGRRVSVGGSLDRSPPYVGVILEAD